MPVDWRPSASLEIVRLRAQLLAQIRGFFARRSLLEVETPILGHAAASDPHLQSLSTAVTVPGATATLYLQTSPEYPMKRLLAAGSGPIYQISRVFRDNERGRLHNPEFTLIEWYRPGFDHHALMDEVEELISLVLKGPSCERLTYAEAFHRYGGFDPHSVTLPELHRHAQRLGMALSGSVRDDPNFYLDLILSHCIAPHLGAGPPTFIYDYPDSQAALARVSATHPPVAERFELFVQGIEIANGFHELTDPVEQRARFESDQARRRQSGLPEVPMDERLLAALEHGLPNGAGVALGFDRLVMIRAGTRAIAEVLAFPIERA